MSAAIRRPLAAVGFVLAVLAPLAIAAPALAATHAVDINDGFFSRATLAIAVGDTVTWTNVDGSPHTATADGGVFDSGTLDGGASFSHTFTSAGTFTYVCRFHDEMVGTITVVAAAAPVAPVGTAAPATSTAPVIGAGPDTALPAPEELASWLAPLLIGVGLVAFAIGLFPMHSVAPAGPRRSNGWRR